EFGEHLFGQGFVGTQAEDVFDAVVIAPVHRLLPPVMAVALDRVAKRTYVPRGVSRTGDDGGWPVQPDAADQPADMGTNLFAARRFAVTQDRDYAMASLRVVYMDRRKASFVVMGIEQRHLLVPVHRIGGVVDVQHDPLGWMRVALAPEVHHAARHSYQRAQVRGVFQSLNCRLRGQTAAAFGQLPASHLEGWVMA